MTGKYQFSPSIIRVLMVCLGNICRSPTAHGILEKQINKLKDDHGIIPGKPIPEIPKEQSTVVNVEDPEEGEKIVNLNTDNKK